MVQTTNLGFPRIGPNRELKVATERYWNGEITADALRQTAADIRKSNWIWQRDAGLDLVPSNDFSHYDHVLDTCAMVGAIPDRYEWNGKTVKLDTYFAMARGRAQSEGERSRGKGDVPAMEMTKWFDTNYHYIVPEIHPDQTFCLASTKPIDEYREALALGMETKPVLLGPISFLLLSKVRNQGNTPVHPAKGLQCLDRLLPVYEEVLSRLAKAGANWIQFDEPCLALDRTKEELAAFKRAYDRLANISDSLKIFLTTYFEGLRENTATALSLPVDAVHIDLVRSPQSLDDILIHGVPENMSLSLGIIDGRNVWRTDLYQALDTVRQAVRALGSDRVMIAPSCSLLHVPLDVDQEDQLNGEMKAWLAFAKQKLDELNILKQAINEGEKSVARQLEVARAAQESRKASPVTHLAHIKERTAKIEPQDLERKSAYPLRRQLQQKRLRLPLLPTTTIGSFPQTDEVRRMRSLWRRGEIDDATYKDQIQEEIRSAIRLQEEIGLDVLVHGEFERNDMVEYFGEQLSGFAFTRQGWVQSYGTRCVKPPILYGDVERKDPMTVEWTRFAASLTDRPVKGMLTGPVTILQWSFVRDDQPLNETCRQIALAIRDEVKDLEAAGIPIIQIDEAAFQEGAPLRKQDRKAYYDWAVSCFRLASSGVRDETQIHTHMCYSEFNHIMNEIAAMDADVISIEASRSNMELLSAFLEFDYPRDIGPGVYDIHSPRVPYQQEIEELIHRSLERLQPNQLWINPDCGLKTRRYEEVVPALRTMVRAAHNVRAQLAEHATESAGL